MTLYTIGSSKKSSRQFFQSIKYYMIQILVDVRLKNDSQLLGFTRKRDLPYLLELHNCKYEHCVNFAPTKDILTDWKKKRITWPEYETRYHALMTERNAVHEFITSYDGLYEAVCLLCSEPTPKYCHRRLFAEMVTAELPGTEIIHIR